MENTPIAPFDHLLFPQGLLVEERLGSGKRSEVFKASFDGARVVLKVYNQQYSKKYRQQYHVNIAEFEFDRNSTMYAMPGMSRFVAKPYALVYDNDKQAAGIIQEYVGGVRLRELIEAHGGLPSEVLQAGEHIITTAAKHDLFDLDISPGNIRVLKDATGYYPKLYDFNLMPQHLFPPNPFMRIGFALRLRSKNHRDYRSLREWQRHGRRAQRSRGVS